LDLVACTSRFQKYSDTLAPREKTSGAKTFWVNTSRGNKGDIATAMPLGYSSGGWVHKEISKLPRIMVGFIEKLGGDTLEANPMNSYFVEYTGFWISPATPQPWRQGVRILLKSASTFCMGPSYKI